MRILITGSSGQIGTNLALHLQAAGHEVFGVDRRPNSWTTAIPTLLQDLAVPYQQFVGGIGGAPYPTCDVVVHLAANAKVHELVTHPHKSMENIAATFNVLEYCRHQQVPIIFASSREVYGDIHRYLTDEQTADFAYTESPYSASKIAGESLVYAYARCYGLRYIVFRFSNVYGRYDNDIERMERVIPLFMRELAAGRPVTVFGRDKTLDFTHVDDCVAGVMRGIERIYAGQIDAATINLAYGQGHTLVAMAQLIAYALDIPAPDIRVEESKRVGEVTYYIADLRRAQELLGYVPQIDLARGIAMAVAWQRDWQQQSH
ncbi:MAG: NAD(P)-dependent oxidoreductase [Chloroflexi bacterium]|nr:NAD(P)-dependent oxidoreductase [Chloroflexota bacterium]